MLSIRFLASNLILPKTFRNNFPEMREYIVETFCNVIKRLLKIYILLILDFT